MRPLRTSALSRRARLERRTARRERNGSEMGETTGGRKSAGIRRSPGEHARARKKKGQPRTVDLYILVEAPGIEPGSERFPATGPTRVSRSGYVIGNLRACNRSRPRPLISTRTRRLASRPDPAGAVVPIRYPALTGGRADLFRPREPWARSRFCLVGFLRGLLTNHGAHLVPSILRRSQFAPMTNCRKNTCKIRGIRTRSSRPAPAAATETKIRRESGAGRFEGPVIHAGPQPVRAHPRGRDRLSGAPEGAHFSSEARRNQPFFSNASTMPVSRSCVSWSPAFSATARAARTPSR